MTENVLIFAGSTRDASLNRKVAHCAAWAAGELNLNVTHLDLRDYPLPLYQGDIEATAGMPRASVALRALLKRHAIWLIASPDYNCSVSPLLKNVIDWTSRPFNGEHYLACFKDKRIGLMSSSPGFSGGSRGLPHLRQILAHLGARVSDREFVVRRGMEAFDEKGVLRDPDLRLDLRRFVATVTEAVPMPAALSVA